MLLGTTLGFAVGLAARRTIARSEVGRDRGERLEARRHRVLTDPQGAVGAGTWETGLVRYVQIGAGAFAPHVAQTPRGSNANAGRDLIVDTGQEYRSLGLHDC